MSTTNRIFFLVSLAIVIFTIAELFGLVKLDYGRGKEQAFQSKGKLEAVCEVTVSKPDEDLKPPFETVRMTLPLVVDFDESTGAYAGEHAISLNRKGTLKAEGDMLRITRQAMFKRYGVVIQGEHVELNRRTGELRQWLDLEGDKRLELISGKCKRSDNAPF